MIADDEMGEIAQYKIVYEVMQNGIKDISHIIRDIMDYYNL